MNRSVTLPANGGGERLRRLIETPVATEQRYFDAIAHWTGAVIVLRVVVTVPEAIGKILDDLDEGGLGVGQYASPYGIRAPQMLKGHPIKLNRAKAPR